MDMEGLLLTAARPVPNSAAIPLPEALSTGAQAIEQKDNFGVGKIF
jgi:hypothetical protein